MAIIINEQGQTDVEYVERLRKEGHLELANSYAPFSSDKGVALLNDGVDTYAPWDFKFICSDPIVLVQDNDYVDEVGHGYYQSTNYAKYMIYSMSIKNGELVRDNKYYYEAICYTHPESNNRRFVVDITDIVTNWVHGDISSVVNVGFDRNDESEIYVGYSFLIGEHTRPQGVGYFQLRNAYSDKRFQALDRFVYNSEYYYAMIPVFEKPLSPKFRLPPVITKDTKINMFFNGAINTNLYVMLYNKELKSVSEMIEIAKGDGTTEWSSYITTPELVLNFIGYSTDFDGYMFFKTDQSLNYGYLFRVNATLCPRYTVYYETPEGCIDHIFGNSASVKEAKFTSIDYTKDKYSYSQYGITNTPYNFSNSRYMTTTEDIFTIHTFAMHDDKWFGGAKNVNGDIIVTDTERIRNCMNSTMVIIYDNVEKVYHSVLPMDTTWKQKTTRIDKRINYTLKFKKSQPYIRR